MPEDLSMTATPVLRPELPPLPPRLAALPIDGRGYPVPFFVAWPNGVPDHRIMDPAKWVRCVTEGLCWLCGQALGIPVTFAIGPMCAVNRISSEPPQHRECAEYAVVACPFLSRPHAHRREAGKPATVQSPGGTMIGRNPGVILLWTTKAYRVVGDGKGGRLIEVGTPIDLAAYTEGRRATWPEVDASIESGLPFLLRTLSGSDVRGRRALGHAVREARRLLSTSIV
jgi:hypothetical protein